MATSWHKWDGGKRKVAHPVPAVVYEQGIGREWIEIVLRRQSPAGKGGGGEDGGANMEELSSDVYLGAIIPCECRQGPCRKQKSSSAPGDGRDLKPSAKAAGWEIPAALGHIGQGWAEN